MKTRADDSPERLVEGEGPAAELLRRFARQPPQAPGENAAWDGTLARLGRDAGRHRGRVIVALAVGAVAGAAALYMASFRHAPFVATRTRAPAPLAPAPAFPVAPLPPFAPAPIATGPAVPSPVITAPAIVDAPHIQLGRAAVGLPVGAAELVGEADVTLSRGGQARAFATPTAATVELAAGALELHVEKRRADAGHAFEVEAGPYRFTVLGTVFRVSRANGDVTLSVTEGRVAVSLGRATLAVITAGGSWMGGTKVEAPAPAPAPAAQATNVASPRGRLVAMRAPARVPTAPAPSVPAVVPDPAVPIRDGGECAARAAAGDVTGAVACYATAAEETDLGAEVALYEAARLYRDALGQPAQAVATLQEARRRFPNGVLSTEVSLSLAELLPKLGRYREALDEATVVLDRHPAGPRAAELHLLRGDVLRSGLTDCAAAQTDYAAAARSRDERVADPAAFGRAACLEAMGRRAEARDAFAGYLARPRPARAAEAERHLRALGSAAP